MSEHRTGRTGARVLCVGPRGLLPVGAVAAGVVAVAWIAGVRFAPAPRAANEALPGEIPVVIYDNDDYRDVYTDEYVLALASAGEIRLGGMITASSVAPYNRWVSTGDYAMFLAGRRVAVAVARRSGLRDLPPVVAGPARHLDRPASGRIEDTRPIRSSGARLIVREALEATPERPLHLIMGGVLTSAADAYLIEPSIADRVQVSWLGGRPDDMADYNGWADPWAAYIVLQRLRLVQYPAQETGRRGAPRVQKRHLWRVPARPLRQWMVAKQHPTNRLPGSRDADAPPAIGLMRSDYVLETRTVSFGHWLEQDDRSIPAFREDANGRAVVVIRADRAVATEEWWRALTNRSAYGEPMTRPGS